MRVRLPLIFVMVGAISIGAGVAVAQSPPSEGEVVAQNPVLRQVAQVDPDILKNLLDRLAAIRGEPTREGAARGESPTENEQRQIAANPIFAEAFVKSPTETLGILRQVNAFLDEPRSARARQ
jgi:hypothetical protein